MTSTSEIAPGTYRICTYVHAADMQFNQFLIVDNEPLLYHTGTHGLFPRVRDAVAEILDPSAVRWIAFSHFEADECGCLNEWLGAAPLAEPMCSACGALVSVNDIAVRKARPLGDGEIVETGTHRLRFLATPHLPHGWDAGHLVDETTGVLFSSDLLHQNGDVEPITTEDVVGRMKRVLKGYAGSPFDRYIPWTPWAEAEVERLAALAPRMVAPMHGSAYAGDGAAALRAMAAMLAEVYGLGAAGS
jgi:flavorubredoxin